MRAQRFCFLPMFCSVHAELHRCVLFVRRHRLVSSAIVDLALFALSSCASWQYTLPETRCFITFRALGLLTSAAADDAAPGTVTCTLVCALFLLLLLYCFAAGSPSLIHEVITKLLQDRSARAEIVNAALQISTTAMCASASETPSSRGELKPLLPVDFSRGITNTVASQHYWLIEHLALLGLKALCLVMHVRAFA